MASDRSKLRSQYSRTINFQGDALRMGMNWTEEDLGKPQILVDSAYGMGHPGTFHFRPLIEEISNGVFEAGGKPGVFYVSDICDGVAQATSGMSYSLVSRDVMAAMVEIHALGHPAHLSAIARCKLPAIHVPGGTQFNAPDYFTSNKLAERRARWTPKPPSHEAGILGLYSRVATEAAAGGELTAPHRHDTLPSKETAPAPRGDGRGGGDGRGAEPAGGERAPVLDLHGGTVVIADYDFGDVDIERAIIEGAGFRLVGAQCKSEGDVIAAARDAVGVITQYARVGARAVEAFTRCQVIARYGTGVDIVDVDAATRRGIQVTNAPNEWCADEVADHAIALWLAAVRKITQYDAATRRGEWHWQTGQPIHRMRGRVFGLLSFGTIARGIAERAKAFGVELWVHDPFVDPDEIRRAGGHPVSFDELARGSDYLVIQAPLTPDTRGLFDEKVLRSMKPTAILVNTARGPIVPDAALHRALAEGWIAGAALDDIEEEPAKQLDWQPTNPLFQQPNAIITPHAAYYSEEALRSVREIAANEVIRVLTGQHPLSPVNFVEAAMHH